MIGVLITFLSVSLIKLAISGFVDLWIRCGSYREPCDKFLHTLGSVKQVQVDHSSRPDTESGLVVYRANRAQMLKPELSSSADRDLIRYLWMCLVRGLWFGLLNFNHPLNMKCPWSPNPVDSYLATSPFGAFG